ncbi:hypothetical protein WJX74_004101 [Apatococcus lobatus]|uniref:Uncharacterized protein n=1 Tax=Apatococcus lobatus TaxID=904363 RepID=A0AAW1Q2T7_9CHLO
MSNPLSAPFATAATGSLGTSVPVTQSASTSDASNNSPQLTTAYNSPPKMQQYLDRLKAFVLKWKWAILVVIAAGAAWYMGSGRQALCSNFGIACDTRPLPGGVREV